MGIELSPAILAGEKLIVSGRKNGLNSHSITEFDLITGRSTEHLLDLFNSPHTYVGDISSIIELGNEEYIISGFTKWPVGLLPLARIMDIQPNLILITIRYGSMVTLLPTTQSMQ